MFPQGYHITLGTHGSRLPGSAKPFVDRGHNEYAAPLPDEDRAREDAARERMKGEPVTLSPEQRKVVEQAINDVAKRYGWTIHSKAAQSDHVHVVITAPREGDAL